MFFIEFRKGKFNGEKRTYTTARRALGSVFNSLYETPAIYYKIREWMIKAEHNKKATNLTVANTIRIEYRP